MNLVIHALASVSASCAFWQKSGGRKATTYVFFCNPHKDISLYLYMQRLMGNYGDLDMVQWDKAIGNIIWEITRHTYPNMIMVYNIGILIWWDTFLFFNSFRWKPLHMFFLVNIVLFHSYDKSPRGTWKRKVKNKQRWLTHSNHHSITTYHYHYRGFWVKLVGFKAHLLNRLPECPWSSNAFNIQHSWIFSITKFRYPAKHSPLTCYYYVSPLKSSRWNYP